MLPKSLAWMKPYLNIAGKIVPEVHLFLDHIRAYKPRVDTEQRQAAAIIKSKYGFTITLSTHYIWRVKDKKTKEYKNRAYPYSTIDLLGSLAHELAHLVHWDHSTQHKALECRLQRLFMKKLAKTGYVSEEDELSLNARTCRRRRV